MPTYTFDGIDAQGREVRSEVEAGSEQEALARIRSMGVRPIRVSNKSGRAGAGGKSGKKKKFNINIGGIKSKDITQFTRQFATLIDAGLPIVRSLDILANQQKMGPFRSAIEAISDDVKGGSSLSESMGRHPKVFDRLYTNMVRAGEAGGVLDTILTRLAEFREKSEALRRKIIGSMVYPCTVMLIAGAILSFIMVYVIPQFKKMFEEMQLKEGLPPLTEMLIKIAEFMKTMFYPVPYVLLIPFIIFGIYRAIVANPKGRYMIDTLKLNIPIFGQIIRKGAVSRFCRTLGTLLESGVSILDALNILRGAIGNAVIANAVGEVHAAIREGDNIATPLKRCRAFDDLVVNMIDVGEETGELPRMLTKIADNYDSEVDATVSGLTALLEPVMIIAMGSVVGFIVISLFLPMVSMMKQLSEQS